MNMCKLQRTYHDVGIYMEYISKVLNIALFVINQIKIVLVKKFYRAQN